MKGNSQLQYIQEAETNLFTIWYKNMCFEWSVIIPFNLMYSMPFHVHNFSMYIINSWNKTHFFIFAKLWKNFTQGGLKFDGGGRGQWVALYSLLLFYLVSMYLKVCANKLILKSCYRSRILKCLGVQRLRNIPIWFGYPCLPGNITV